MIINFPGHTGEDKQPLNPTHTERIQKPPRFVNALYEILTPGTTLLVTDTPELEQQMTGVTLYIMNSD